MSSKYKFLDQDCAHFISYAVVGWMDVFTRNEYKNILLDSWKHCEKKKGLVIHAWIIMTNHVHMIISRNGEYKLQDIVRDFKKYTSTKICSAILCNAKESRKEWMINYFDQCGKENSNNKNRQFWQQDNHPIYVESENVIQQELEYLHENPVRAGFVKRAEDWIYSSATDYYTQQKRLIDIVHL